MFGLQRLEFAHQAVVLDVRDVRLVEDVVAMVGVVDQAAQFGDAGGGFGGHCGILGHRVWWMRALAWYSRLDWQAAPRRSGFSRELFGRAARKSVVSGKSVSVRVDLGGVRIINTKKIRENQNNRTS